MRIIYISTSCSQKKYQQVYEMRSVKAIEPQQKFNALLIEGLSLNEDITVDVISALPVSSSTCSQKKFCYEKELISESLTYHYIPFRNGKVSRLYDILKNTRQLLKVLLNQYKDDNCYIIVDALCVFMAAGCFDVAQKYNVPMVGIVTDLPNLATKMKANYSSLLKHYAVAAIESFNMWTLNRYNGYIALTESINEAINELKPYLIVEGSVDCKLKYSKSKMPEPKIVVYAGGIYEKYGLKTLVEAFRDLKTEDQLHIYGNGSYVAEINEINKENPNIKYMGMASLEEIIEIERNASLLVNPRPSNEEFSKYSFPSKTLEYMSSGTPLLSTRLPGIPDIYFSKIYSIEDETKDGVKNALVNILKQDNYTLLEKGRKAFEFVESEKTNKIQGEKIAKFLKTRFK